MLFTPFFLWHIVSQNNLVVRQKLRIFVVQYYNKSSYEPANPNISHVARRKKDFSFLRAFPRACALVQWLYLKRVSSE